MPRHRDGVQFSLRQIFITIFLFSVSLAIVGYVGVLVFVLLTLYLGTPFIAAALVNNGHQRLAKAVAVVGLVAYLGPLLLIMCLALLMR